MNLDYIALGGNIRKHRKLAGMTQRELSEIVDCSDRHIGQIEKGINIPSLAMTVSIANALDVGIDQLVYGDLNNRTNYFVQELVELTDGFEAKDKIMAMELTKSITTVLKDMKLK